MSFIKSCVNTVRHTVGLDSSLLPAEMGWKRCIMIHVWILIWAIAAGFTSAIILVMLLVGYSLLSMVVR